MGRRRQAAPAAPVEALRRRLDQWRKTQRKRTRIPEEVWGSAEQLAREYGVHPVASTLRLNYERLKERVEAGAKTPSVASAPLFVELEAGRPQRQPECLIELEDRAGQKMTIRLGSASGLDLVGLTATFWRRRR